MRHSHAQRKTVLVAGATGILGVHVVQQLVANEYDVIGLIRPQVKRTLLEGLGARAVIVDVLDAAALAQVLRQTTPTAVIHLLTAFPRAGRSAHRSLQQPTTCGSREPPIWYVRRWPLASDGSSASRSSPSMALATWVIRSLKTSLPC